MRQKLPWPRSLSSWTPLCSACADKNSMQTTLTAAVASTIPGTQQVLFFLREGVGQES